MGFVPFQFSCMAVETLSSISAIMHEKGRKGVTMISGLYLMPGGEDISLRLVLCTQRSLTCSLKTTACTLVAIYEDLDSSARGICVNFSCRSCQLTLRQRNCCARCMQTRRLSVEGSRVARAAWEASQNPWPLGLIPSWLETEVWGQLQGSPWIATAWTQESISKSYQADEIW